MEMVEPLREMPGRSANVCIAPMHNTSLHFGLGEAAGTFFLQAAKRRREVTMRKGPKK
jgi:hypothetical protein